MRENRPRERSEAIQSRETEATTPELLRSARKDEFGVNLCVSPNALIVKGGFLASRRRLLVDLILYGTAHANRNWHGLLANPVRDKGAERSHTRDDRDDHKEMHE